MTKLGEYLNNTKNVGNEIELVVSKEELATKLIQMIETTYGKQFIENAINIKHKKRTYVKGNSVIARYNELSNQYPDKNLKEIKSMTAIEFGISLKGVEAHIYKKDKDLK